MKLVYASRMGKTEKFVHKLGILDSFKITTGEENVADDYVLVTYTDGKGVVPSIVEKFLEHNHAGLKAVVAGGSMERHAETFGFAGDKISNTYNVPLIAKMDGEGTDADIEVVKTAILAL